MDRKSRLDDEEIGVDLVCKTNLTKRSGSKPGQITKRMYVSKYDPTTAEFWFTQPEHIKQAFKDLDEITERIEASVRQFPSLFDDPGEEHDEFDHTRKHPESSSEPLPF